MGDMTLVAIPVPGPCFPPPLNPFQFRMENLFVDKTYLNIIASMSSMWDAFSMLNDSALTPCLYS